MSSQLTKLALGIAGAAAVAAITGQIARADLQDDKKRTASAEAEVSAQQAPAPNRSTWLDDDWDVDDFFDVGRYDDHDDDDWDDDHDLRDRRGGDRGDNVSRVPKARTRHS